MATTITLRPEHGYVMLAAGILSFEVFAIGGAVGVMRGKLFGKDFKKRPGVVALFEEHKKAVGSQPFCSQGYPDMGNGRFAEQLTYAEWLSFNNAQRGHQNALETLPGVLACLFAGGAVYPATSAALAGLYGVGRPLYAWGYRKWGSGGRTLGVLLADVGLFGLFGVAIRAGLKVAGIA